MIQSIFSKFHNQLLALTLILRLKTGGGKKNLTHNKNTQTIQIFYHALIQETTAFGFLLVCRTKFATILPCNKQLCTLSFHCALKKDS